MPSTPTTVALPHSPWPHRLAVLLCCGTFPLVWVGGLVTTYQAGMAVPDWPTTYGYNLFLYPISTWLLGPWDLFIEHGHRLFAALVGLVTIALCVAVFVAREPRWLKALALVALVAVVFQGVLGGMRVVLDERRLAMTHGSIGPAFFALTAAIAVCTSRWWREGNQRGEIVSGWALPALALFTPLLAYIQIVLGAHLRHISPEQTRETFQNYVVSHIATAVALTIDVVAMAWMFWRTAPKVRRLTASAVALVVLIAGQLCLGAATWVVNYGWPAFLSGGHSAAAFTVEAQSWLQSQITTAHVAVGSLILAISTALAMASVRMLRVRPVTVAGAGRWKELAL